MVANHAFRQMWNRGIDAYRVPAMKTHLKDAALAALLLVSTWAGLGVAVTPLWWTLIGLCAAAVAVRHRWPIPAFATALLATVPQAAMNAVPAPADLAVPIVLYTIAAHRRRTVSLTALGVALAVVAGWSVATSSRDWGLILVLVSLLLVAWAIGWGVWSRAAYVAELERERDQRAELAVAAERARITRELHDVVAHGLAVIVMQAQGGAAAFEKRPADTLAALDTIVATGRASLADMRQVLTEAPMPGLARLPRLADEVRRAGTPVELRVDGTPRALPAGVDVSAYRIVQEALTNTMKHAGAGARARVVVIYGSDELLIEAGDDGNATPDAGHGTGLRGMRERVALLNGELTTGPGPDGGYAIKARIPLVPGRAA